MLHKRERGRGSSQISGFPALYNYFPAFPTSSDKIYFEFIFKRKQFIIFQIFHIKIHVFQNISNTFNFLLISPPKSILMQIYTFFKSFILRFTVSISLQLLPNIFKLIILHIEIEITNKFFSLLQKYFPHFTTTFQLLPRKIISNFLNLPGIYCRESGELV